MHVILYVVSYSLSWFGESNAFRSMLVIYLFQQFLVQRIQIKPKLNLTEKNLIQLKFTKRIFKYSHQIYTSETMTSTKKIFSIVSKT